jgi:hypothetical protein
MNTCNRESGCRRGRLVRGSPAWRRLGDSGGAVVVVAGQLGSRESEPRERCRQVGRGKFKQTFPASCASAGGLKVLSAGGHQDRPRWMRRGWIIRSASRRRPLRHRDGGIVQLAAKAVDQPPPHLHQSMKSFPGHLDGEGSSCDAIQLFHCTFPTCIAALIAVASMDGPSQNYGRNVASRRCLSGRPD